jgi:hypothetical protein
MDPVNIADALRSDESRVEGTKKLEGGEAESISAALLEIPSRKMPGVKPSKRWRERRDSNPRPPP